jgi:hypothetical protein
MEPDEIVYVYVIGVADGPVNGAVEFDRWFQNVAAVRALDAQGKSP